MHKTAESYTYIQPSNSDNSKVNKHLIHHTPHECNEQRCNF